MGNIFRGLVIILFVSIAFSSCKKDSNDDDDGYKVPSTYTFTDANGNSTVDFSGQTARLDQLEEIVTYMKTANTTGVALDTQQLMDMYTNTNNNGNGHFSFTADKQLKNKTFSLDRGLVEQFFRNIAEASTSTVEGSNGVAGVVTSNNGERKYLLADSGIDYTELIQKLLMGSVFYYQATSVYLSDDKMNVDNTTAVDPENGKYYTAMEHHWDEAFGYFTDATNYPIAGTDRFWGEYVNARDGVLGCNAKIMNAFIAGRAAISNNDLEARATQIDIIRTEWERAIAATIISYLKKAKTNFADDAIRNHQISEAIGFLYCLKYNEQKTMTDQDAYNSISLLVVNLNNITTQDIDAVINNVSSTFNMQDIVSQL